MGQLKAIHMTLISSQGPTKAQARKSVLPVFLLGARMALTSSVALGCPLQGRTSGALSGEKTQENCKS